MKKHILLLLSALGLTLALRAQEGNISGLDAQRFHRYWKVESESPDYSVTFRGDTAEIVAPKGLTLWRREKMSGRVSIEYDACVVVERPGDRLSDLNCFWMASDPRHPENLWARERWRSGIFPRCYSLRLYYMGYGGNHNTTTRFRRYDGDEAGVADPARRPAILREYTDPEHLLQPNRWYRIRITGEDGRVCYYIDGRRLVDFRDADPLREGWFGFRTTLSRTRITNFRYTCTPRQSASVPLHWVGDAPVAAQPVSFGVPFDPGAVQPEQAWQLRTAGGESLSVDHWPLAYWPDGSVKWMGLAGVVPGGAEGLSLHPAPRQTRRQTAANPSPLRTTETAQGICIETGVLTAYIPKQGDCLLDSLLFRGVRVAGSARLVASTQSHPAAEAPQGVAWAHYTGRLKRVEVERAGRQRALVRLEGVHRSADGREWLPFVVRLYFYAGSEQVRLVHSFVYDGEAGADFIRSLGISFDVPLREALYNRHIAFSTADGGVWSEPVQPLVGRRLLEPAEARWQERQMRGERIPPYESFDPKSRELIDDWAAWSDYRLSQISPDAFSIRKRAATDRPWVGTFSGTRSPGYAFAGDVSGGLGLCLHDFWRAYPSTLEVTNARTPTATLTAWLWSPEAEPMDLRHYDHRGHGLNASYEDIQEGMSTPYGIARTSVLTLAPQGGYAGKETFAARAVALSQPGLLLPVPAYLHARRAFGVWSLPDSSTPLRKQVEERLEAYTDFYLKAIEQHKWYGFWDYGDLMHAYDPVRHTWRYDVGGYAWDNTELASNMWLWYSFLRTGRADLWRMAEAMTRHTGEVDVYHLGPHAGLGSRHNVSHWGCGAKEARISQAAWNRFYYYLTTDERCGDLMTEVRDAEQKLYELDPMRLAQPRSEYPCTAPARIRIGPDWLAYAGNWMTEWERTRNTAYRDKIVAGMKSIAALPGKLFTGPKALGFDPATGIISTECDPRLESSNHLMAIMGGFEVMNELMPMVELPAWREAWLDHAARYKQKAWELNRSRFRISRLLGYAAYHLRDGSMAKEAWTDLFTRLEHTPAPPVRIHTVLPPQTPTPMLEWDGISTNDAAIWSLDAIYMQEVIPLEE